MQLNYSDWNNANSQYGWKMAADEDQISSRLSDKWKEKHI